MTQGGLKADTPQDRASAQIVRGLEHLGYRGPLLRSAYAFPDWFANQEERQVFVAAFAQTPVSYESACIGVVRTNGVREQELVNGFRALGAPVLLEIDTNEVREWAISRQPNQHSLVAKYSLDQIGSVFSQRGHDWKPEELLRAKNIGEFRWTKQLGLFSGLLPELESEIRQQLDPILRDTLSATRRAYVDSSGNPPGSQQLFKLVFWILTAKVFHDRGMDPFDSLDGDPDLAIAAVAKHYGESIPRLLNREARETAAAHAWPALDFRNLSVEVLSQIWSTTLVDRETRKRLGIHRTSRTIVRYLVDRIPFSQSGDDARVVFEPCSGSAAFLIGAMHALRQRLFGVSSQERHEYFVKHLAGLEYDPFGVEISTLALTLADFPNPKGWNLTQGDVFRRASMSSILHQSGVVLCNPPFEAFDASERRLYQPEFLTKPAELLRLVLADLHPSGVLGFVLPLVFVDGKQYRPIREQLANRFASLEMTVLPDRAFDKADTEVAILVATDPIPHDVCRVSYRRVDDQQSAWTAFERQHEVTSESSANFGTEAARRGFTIPALPEIWTFLVNYPTLGSVADIHRGLEWHPRSKLVRSDWAPGYRLGVQPRTRFDIFEVPLMCYLSMREEDQRRSFWRQPWDKPKVIFNKSTRSRGRWRLAAFPDSSGVTCYQTYNAAWSRSDKYDEIILAAVLNGPVANAFVSTREGKTDLTKETLQLIPMPVFNEEQRGSIRALVAEYQAASSKTPLERYGNENPEALLKLIDATVLAGYRLPARLERKLLDFFDGHRRPVSHEFNDYFPKDLDVLVSLADYLSPKFGRATIGTLLKRIERR